MKRRGVKGVLEAYRCIHFEGLRITPQASFENKAFIWQVQEVTLDKLREAVETFELKLDQLEEMDGYTMQEDDKLQALLKMCPHSVRLKMLEERGRGLYQTYECLREHLFHLVVDIQDCGASRRLARCRARTMALAQPILKVKEVTVLKVMTTVSGRRWTC